MNLTDPVADFLTRIRNSIRARHQKLDVPASKLKAEIARILKEEGYIANYKPTEENGQKVLRVYLKYVGSEKIISGIVRVSRPGRRIYVTKDKIPTILGGMGVAILSTSAGVMTDRQARAAGQGGEVLCIVA